MKGSSEPAAIVAVLPTHLRGRLASLPRLGSDEDDGSNRGGRIRKLRTAEALAEASVPVLAALDVCRRDYAKASDNEL